MSRQEDSKSSQQHAQEEDVNIASAFAEIGQIIFELITRSCSANRALQVEHDLCLILGLQYFSDKNMKKSCNAKLFTRIPIRS